MSKTLTKVLALVLALVMVFALAGCGKTAAESAATEPTKAETPDAAAEPVEEVNDTLVVGYSPFNEKFSPFFSETAYDQEASTMTQLALLGNDRKGAIIYNGIDGETINYNGTDYTYYGPANCVVTENPDGTVYYDFTLRDDITFSDGEPVTVDDVIFSMYVVCDPTYDGSNTLFGLKIEGMEAYREGMDSRGNVILAAGPDGYEANDLYTEEQYNAFWDYYNNNAGADFAQEIVDYCINNGYNAPTDSVSACAANWGFDVPEDATAADFWDIIVDAYGGDIDEAVSVESAGSDLGMLTIAGLGADYQAGVTTGESAPSITGIQKIDDYHMRVVLTEVDATAIYQLGVNIAPLHYYGSEKLFDYDNNSFGFPKGDLSSVRAKTTQPMGAGPYKFIEFKDGVIYYEANENYYLGAPKIPYMNFQQCTTDDDKLNGVITGTIDITDPSFSTDTISAIEAANGGELVGDVVATNTVDNLGYGYIGINAKNVCVNNEPGSDASKNLRKAFGTLFSVYRDVAIDTYYGDRASVINYPISNTSWAAPQPTDDGYKLAFSTDVDGNDIYTSTMTAEEKYEAAKIAALGFLEAAGYTVEDGKAVAAPEGAKMEYVAWIPADGTGDHPTFMVFTEASKAFADIGITLTVKDLTNSSELWDALDAEQVPIWAAAWGATIDPDMYQIYYSDVANGGKNPGGDNSKYAIADAELDQLIMDARTSTDQAYRKAMYKACLDIIIDWADEIPVYQRQNAIIFSAERVKLDTVTPDITTFYPWYSELENIELN